jgi:hypothetical protein
MAYSWRWPMRATIGVISRPGEPARSGDRAGAGALLAHDDVERAVLEGEVRRVATPPVDVEDPVAGRRSTSPSKPQAQATQGHDLAPSLPAHRRAHRQRYHGGIVRTWR